MLHQLNTPMREIQSRSREKRTATKHRNYTSHSEPRTVSKTRRLYTETSTHHYALHLPGFTDRTEVMMGILQAAWRLYKTLPVFRHMNILLRLQSCPYNQYHNNNNLEIFISHLSHKSNQITWDWIQSVYV